MLLWFCCVDLKRVRLCVVLAAAVAFVFVRVLDLVVASVLVLVLF